MLAELEREVDRRVAEAHPQIIAIAIDVVEEAEYLALLPCTYRKFMIKYLDAKRKLRRCERKIAEAWYTPPGLQREAESFVKNATEAEWDVLQYHRLMYTEPCKLCPVCRDRRKQWPRPRQ